ncbi:Cox19-like CHCH family protein [Perilla frutescens var. hirtella]|nr:Cox19-like CHCH family protein [Perilla frutescens var. hirtella]KAH6805129.1 Cox19-like CHCH family protein [Perilla frutescens var. frutescens]
METSQNQQHAVCGKEAIDLLNCVAQSPYDQEKCLSLLQALRQCAIDKKVKKFSLAEQTREQADSSGKKQL